MVVNDYDWWINRDQDTCNIPCDDPVPGTTSAVRDQRWFRWSSSVQLRDKVIEIVACYPNRSLDGENDDRLEAIWDRAMSVLSEQVSIEHDNVPQSVRDQLSEAVSRVQDASKPTLRWQHPSGFRCFLNKGVPEWSVNRWQEAIDFQGPPQTPIAIECRVLRCIALECGNKALSDAIGDMYSVVVSDVSETLPSESQSEGVEEGAAKLRRLRELLIDRKKGVKWTDEECVAIFHVWHHYSLTKTNPTQAIAQEFGYSERTISANKSKGQKIENSGRLAQKSPARSGGPILANMGQSRLK